MWGLLSDEMYRRRADEQGYTHASDWHKTDNQRICAPDESATDVQSEDRFYTPPNGTWGERDVGAPLDPARSMVDYDALR
ncbi:hypothetical protein GJ744_007034 [Endocarpon pusillum]|uniref:Uncharacterized protein n=1 Tax=Endocarpon pusillum TaxID=364733 RepID=A0A8H7AJ99_9EURO|nr:hypothetical protein GJ744_007034 [Endocarpon pusillum]